MSHVSRTNLAALAVTLALLTGCSGGKGITATGSVAIDGKPVEDGYITFYPADGKSPPAGGEIKGGKFSVANVTAGSNRIEVASTGKSVGQATMADAETKSPGKGDSILQNAGGNNEYHEVVAGTPLELKLTSATSGSGLTVGGGSGFSTPGGPSTPGPSTPGPKGR